MREAPRWFASSLLAVLTVLSTACTRTDTEIEAPSPATQTAAAGPCVRVAMGNPLPMLDPFFQTTAASDWTLQGNVWEGLVTMKDGTAQPRLASGWSKEGDLVWLFEIRSGVSFHDGSLLTTADVVASIERARSHLKSDMTALLSRLEHASARGPHTVELRFTTPFATLLHNLSRVPIVAYASTDAALDPLIATGPYRIAHHDADQRLRLERFPGYWGEAPSIECAEYRFESNDRRRVDMLLDGSVDIASGIPPAAIKSIEARKDLWVGSSLGGLVRILLFNVTIPPYNDARVREAIDLGVDREALANGYFEGNARVASQLGAPGTIGYVTSQQPPARNLARARQLVREVAGGRTISLQLYAGDGTPAAGILADQLREVGFDVETIALPWNELYRRLQRREVPLCYMGWRADLVDSGSMLESRIHTLEPDGLFGKANHMSYSNPEADRLLEQSLVTMDPRRRKAILEEVAKLVIKDRPIIPLVRPLNLVGVRRALKWVVPPDPALTLSQMSLSAS
jgi:peptide/nickel transport system substrate-binding protein